MLDDHATQIFAMVDEIAERIRKIGGAALRSIGEIACHQRSRDNDAIDLSTAQMGENCSMTIARRRHFCTLRKTFAIATAIVATASVIENWIDDSERRV